MIGQTLFFQPTILTNSKTKLFNYVLSNLTFPFSHHQQVLF